MKIHELSKISSVNPETIRMYRNLGLLHPEQNPDNHYYHYSVTDLECLLFIRKLRGTGVPLPFITSSFANENIDELRSGVQDTLEKTEAEIRKLEIKREMLELTYRHMQRYQENTSDPVLIEAEDDRIDHYPVIGKEDEILKVWTKNIELFTQTLRIRKEIFMQEELPEWIPCERGLGTYRKIITEYQLPVPEEITVCPKGKYLTASVELTEDHKIRRSQLLPMCRAVKENHYTVESDSTAYLARIYHENDTTRFVYRIRVKIGVPEEE